MHYTELIFDTNTQVACVVSSTLDLDKPINRINRLDLLSLKSLTLGSESGPIYSRDVYSLDDLEFCTSLDTLSICNGRQIEDWSPISGLHGLNDLHITQSALSDISFLADLQSLRHLNLSNNSITEISAISELTHLTELDLTHNYFHDLSPLSNLRRLTILKLGSDPLSQFGYQWTGPKNEQGHIYTYLNLESLSSLTNLRELDISYSFISDIESILELSNLEILEISGCPLTSYSEETIIPKLLEMGVDVNFARPDDTIYESAGIDRN